MPLFLNTEVAGQEVYRFLLAFLVLLAALVVRKLFDSFIAQKLHSLASRTSFRYDDIVIQSLTPPLSAMFLSVGVFGAVMMLDLPREPYDLPQLIIQSFRVALTLIVVWAAYRLCDLITEIVRNMLSGQDGRMAEQFTPLVRQSIRVVVLLLGGILIIQNMGYSVSSLIAGLGIGGLAIALAAQDTVANVFGTVVIFSDKPFKIGDWIRFGEVDGFVETVGFRSIRLRTWSNTTMIIPNKKITSEIIENCTSMTKRRVKMTIGVQYDSPPDKVRELVRRIDEMLRNDEEVNQDFLLVKFTDFGPSSLDIFLYYFTVSTAWAEHLRVREKINLRIMETVHELGLSFAFPSRTIYFGNPVSVDAGRPEILPDRVTAGGEGMPPKA